MGKKERPILAMPVQKMTKFATLLILKLACFATLLDLHQLNHAFTAGFVLLHHDCSELGFATLGLKYNLRTRYSQEFGDISNTFLKMQGIP